jgi:hypothetical protein
MKTQPIVTATLLAVAFSLPSMADTYRDPQDRFEIGIPADWTAEPFGEGVQIKRGASYCVVMEGQAETPQVLVRHLVGQIGGQWTSFQELKQGSATISGVQASFSFNSGVNRGVPSYLKVTALSAAGRTFALIAKIPQNELAAVKPGLDQIEQGFRLKNAVPGGQRSYQTGPDPGASPQQPARMPQPGGPFVGIAIDPSRQTQGSVIAAVAPGGPAEQAGIRAGDVVVSINGRQLSGPSGVPEAIGGSKPGDTLVFGIVRGGRQSAIRVQVGVFQGR